jgi:Outer membrane protein beta-barrel domain
MQKRRYAMCVLALCTAVSTVMAPENAFAQRRRPVPDQGMVAIGGEGGVFFPDSVFESAFTFGGLVEPYLSPRVGLRGSVNFMEPGFDRESEDTLQQVRFGIDVIYNWEGGKWHPFAGGGVGISMLELQDNGRELGDETEVGFNLLGGIEYFLNRRTTLKFEGRYQFVDDVFGIDPAGFALTAGIKRYF